MTKGFQSNRKLVGFDDDILLPASQGTGNVAVSVGAKKARRRNLAEKGIYYSGSYSGLSSAKRVRRELAKDEAASSNVVGMPGTISKERSERKLEAVDQESPNYFLMKENNFTDEYCTTDAGCAVTLSLIKSPLCNSTEAYGAAPTFSVDPELSYFTTNEDGSNDWTTTPFHEVANSNTTPISLEEFVTADSATNEFGSVLVQQ